MSVRARNIRVVRSSLAVLLRIAVLFALTILFLLPSFEERHHFPRRTQSRRQQATAN